MLFLRACHLAPKLAKPLMLVLVGVPGAGKSHLAASLLRLNTPVAGDSQAPDEQHNPAHARDKVLRAAESACSRGHCVVIDRTNFDAKQRAHFTGIARRRKVQVHALVICKPAGAVRGTGQGHQYAQPATQSAAQPLADPAAIPFRVCHLQLVEVHAEEGFDEMCTCRNDAQSDEVARMYACGEWVRATGAARHSPGGFCLSEEKGGGESCCEPGGLRDLRAHKTTERELCLSVNLRKNLRARSF
ncbi:hypothetical protein T492DRAFT_843402 [Pavlovales sp. CCMP2436]|nr:hypothetical protein T492DRAFT_843402 [Pavlovales sp. CCMP2436]